MCAPTATLTDALLEGSARASTLCDVRDALRRVTRGVVSGRTDHWGG